MQARINCVQQILTRILAVALLTGAGSVFADQATDNTFSTLLDDAWEWQLAQNPLFASQLGDHRYDDRWPDLRLSAIHAGEQAEQAFRKRLAAIDPTYLADANKLNYELFRRELDDDIAAQPFKSYLLPIDHQGGVQNLDSTTDLISLASVHDYENWLARMNKIDVYIEQTIALAKQGQKQGYMPPRILMQRLPEQIAAQLVGRPEDSPFYGVFANMPDTIDKTEQQRLKTAAVQAIDTVVIPAYKKLASWFNNEYLPACRDSIGLSALPQGKQWYEYLARHYTTTDMTPAQIHDLGLTEVKRIHSEMQAVIDELGFKGDFHAFLNFLRTDPQFYYTNRDDLYEAYLATAKRIDPELVKLFGKLPRTPYGVKPIPDSIAPATTTAYYTQPAGDGSRAGIYWVNLYKPEVRPKYEIEVLTSHEAVPGHHLQLALQQELGDLPNFRRYGGYTAFIEGWGLYSESLGYDLGLYKDPYSRFGQLTYEMWRAVRLVVDTGMHYDGWTRQQAIDYFKDNAAKTDQDIVNEIDRYIGTPGQALAYKIGQLKIQSLRDKAKKALGEKFDIRRFHDALLANGALPLDVLDQHMSAWIEAQL